MFNLHSGNSSYRKIPASILIMMLINLFNGCSHDAEGSNAYSVYVSGNSVYVAGKYAVGENMIDTVYEGCYWMNGNRVKLDGSDSAHSIFVNGSDVYVAGEYNNRAAYWKNGEMFYLSSIRSNARSIYVENGNIYVAGDYLANTSYIKAYWVNSQRTDISGFGFSNCNADSIYTESGSIYVAVVCSNGTRYYYKDGTEVGLEDTLFKSGGTVFYDGTDIYLAGSDYDRNGEYGAFYVHNGTMVSFPNTEYGHTFGLFVTGENVYVAGYNYDGHVTRACYWENGSLVYLR